MMSDRNSYSCMTVSLHPTRRLAANPVKLIIRVGTLCRHQTYLGMDAARVVNQNAKLLDSTLA